MSTTTRARYYLFKSEPDAYSLDDLEREGRTEWGGVRNYQARNLMREMHPGDLGFFYHSSTTPPGVVGICRVAASAHPDSTQFDRSSEYFDPASNPQRPRWECVDVEFVERLPRLVSLAEIKAQPALADMVLVQRGSRLSVQPVTPAQWRAIIALSRKAAPHG
ncbi:EVE domain-containing protein [bacterium]|nr:MAG: EVE domain-containing protein [bacterium]